MSKQIQDICMSRAVEKGEELVCQAEIKPLFIASIFWRRQWHSTPVFLSRESHGQRSLEGYSPQGHKESDTTEQLSIHIDSIVFPKREKGNCLGGWPLECPSSFKTILPTLKPQIQSLFISWLTMPKPTNLFGFHSCPSFRAKSAS